MKSNQEITETDRAWDRFRSYCGRLVAGDVEVDPVTFRPSEQRDKTDTALVNAIRAQGATPEWTSRLTSRVMTNAVGIARNLSFRGFDQLPDDFAEELTHKTLAKLGGLDRPLSSLWRFMGVIGRNMAYDDARKRRVRSCPSLAWRAVDDDHTAPPAEPATALATSLLGEIASLGPFERAVVEHLVRRDVHGHLLPDIARAAGADRRTVSRHIAGVLAVIRQRIAERHPDVVARVAQRYPEGYRAWRAHRRAAPGGKAGKHYVAFWSGVGRELRAMGIAG